MVYRSIVVLTYCNIKIYHQLGYYSRYKGHIAIASVVSNVASFSTILDNIKVIFRYVRCRKCYTVGSTVGLLRHKPCC